MAAAKGRTGALPLFLDASLVRLCVWITHGGTYPSHIPLLHFVRFHLWFKRNLVLRSIGCGRDRGDGRVDKWRDMPTGPPAFPHLLLCYYQQPILWTTLSIYLRRLNARMTLRGGRPFNTAARVDNVTAYAAGVVFPHAARTPRTAFLDARRSIPAIIVHKRLSTCPTSPLYRFAS